MDKSRNEIEFIRNCIRDSGALDETIRKHRELIDKSYKHLDGLVMKKYNKNVMRGVIESIEDIQI